TGGYGLHEHQDQVMTLVSFGQKSVENMVAGIDNSKEKPFEKELFGLGIRHLGETISRIVAYHFKSIDRIGSASATEIGSVYEIGERIAESVAQYFADPENQRRIEILKGKGLKLEVEQSEEIVLGDQLSGKSFVISGTFALHSREELNQ